MKMTDSIDEVVGKITEKEVMHTMPVECTIEYDGSIGIEKAVEDIKNGFLTGTLYKDQFVEDSDKMSIKDTKMDEKYQVAGIYVVKEGFRFGHGHFVYGLKMKGSQAYLQMIFYGDDRPGKEYKVTLKPIKDGRLDVQEDIV
jgi:hypothetical protein